MGVYPPPLWGIGFPTDYARLLRVRAPFFSQQKYKYRRETSSYSAVQNSLYFVCKKEKPLIERFKLLRATDGTRTHEMLEPQSSVLTNFTTVAISISIIEQTISYRKDFFLYVQKTV